MNKPVKIDFVSDIACPWCAVGFGALEQALTRLGDEVAVDIHFQPFELNPHMPVGGQEVIEHLTQKYGLPEAQIRANQENIRARAAAVGFAFHPEGRKHVYNTFNAHRLLHWASVECNDGAQRRLKRELLETYFTLAVNLDDTENLIDAVRRAGLDGERARQILSTNEFELDVRERQRQYTDMGISSVPSIILNGKYLLQGAQPAEQFERAIRQVAAES